MHRAQDYYSHYEACYRWDPGNTSLPCNGFGHGCIKGMDADDNLNAWNKANRFTRQNVFQYIEKCGCPPKLPKKEYNPDVVSEK